VLVLRKQTDIRIKDTPTKGISCLRCFRPQIDMDDIMKFDKVKSYIEENDLDQEILEQAEIQVKYSGYIDKERTRDKLTRLEDENSRGFDYHQIKSCPLKPDKAK
jgi:tRNA uridine 5-carboxymethylaminomethyl modification enzyme